MHPAEPNRGLYPVTSSPSGAMSQDVCEWGVGPARSVGRFD